MNRSFLEALQIRRSQYDLSGDTKVPREEIIHRILTCVEATPSAFNCQSAHVMVLFDENHRELWQIVLEELEKVTPKGAFEKTTRPKIESFAAAYATVLYFDDTVVMTQLMQDFPLYAENFPVWAQQVQGLLAGNIWTALSDAGLGASLQHYSPLIEERVRARWDIPESWKMSAQMPFGRIVTPAEPKEKLPLEQRLRIVE